jgi:hypothetical protein
MNKRYKRGDIEVCEGIDRKGRDPTKYEVM